MTSLHRDFSVGFRVGRTLDGLFRFGLGLFGLGAPGLGVLSATVVVAPTPPGLGSATDGRVSSVYQVSVDQGGSRQDSFVCEIPADREMESRHNVCSFTTFSFDGRVTVEVRRKGGAPIKTCSVHPLSYGIEPQILTPDSVRFVLETPRRNMVVIFDDDWDTHPLMVFADPIEDSPPRRGDPDVVWFGPGVHEPGQIRLASSQTLYLAPGAYVKGWIQEKDLTNVLVCGRGILSAESRPGGRGGLSKQTLAFDGEGSNIRVEGITFIQQQGFACTVRGRSNVVRGVRIVGNWHPTTDGIVIGDRGLIEDCFIKADDDSIKLYGSGVTARRCVIWQMENGGVFQHGWTQQNARGNQTTDMDIIRTEWTTTDRSARGVIASVGLSGPGGDHRFENIRVEGGGGRIISLNTKPGSEATWTHVLIRNLTVDHWEPVEGCINGPGFRDITFENFRLNGQWVTNAGQAGILVTNGAQNIRFVVRD